MKQLEFEKLLKEYVIPLFAGARIESGNITESTSREKVAAHGGSGVILVKPHKAADFRVSIFREQLFTNNDVNLASCVISELYKIFMSNIPVDYKNKLYALGIENAICSHLSPESASVIAQLLLYLSSWAERTYEGRRVSFGCVIDTTTPVGLQINTHLHLSKILEEDFSALLSDGVNSWVVFDKYGFLVKHEVATSDCSETVLSPYRFGKFAETCSDSKNGFALLSNGEILIFNNQQLIFAKRRGSWRCFNHEAIIKRITAKSKHTVPEINLALYLTALDVSFSRVGGCIAYLRKTKVKLALRNHVKDSDLIDNPESPSIKSSALLKIIENRPFHILDRKLRQEILGIDGATIIDNAGNVLSAGAIISIGAGSTGGGRLAATKTLSTYGVAVKISTDGMIQGYYAHDSTQNDHAHILFSVG